MVCLSDGINGGVMKLVTVKSIAAACGVSTQDVNREVKALWKAGRYDRKIFYSGLALTAVFALAFGFLSGLLSRYIEMPAYVTYIGIGVIIFFGFRAAIYASLEPLINARLSTCNTSSKT